MCHDLEFDSFRDSLTCKERDAIEAWLGVWYEPICTYQRTGEGDSQVVKLEASLSAALQKAVVCSHTVFRGLSDRFSCAARREYMRQLIEGPDVFSLDCHASASLQEDIGVAFTFAEPGDDERTLSVLLEVTSQTGRYLKPFAHKSKDEGEVVLLRGSRYRRSVAERQEDPKPGLEYWVVRVEEIV